jgi:hypothetical protein
LPDGKQIGRQINRRLLEVERVSHNSGLSGDSIQRVVQPAVTEDGKKVPGLKFGHPRVMALLLALNDLRRLRLKGLIYRPPKTMGTFRNPNDFGVNKGLSNLPYLQVTKKTPGEFRTRVIQNGVHPSLLGHLGRSVGGQRDAQQVGHLLSEIVIAKPVDQMMEHGNRYFVTPYGWKVARLFSRLESRVFRPAMAMFTANDAVLPFPLRQSLDRVDADLDLLIYDAFPLPKAG